MPITPTINLHRAFFRFKDLKTHFGSEALARGLVRLSLIKPISKTHKFSVYCSTSVHEADQKIASGEINIPSVLAESRRILGIIGKVGIKKGQGAWSKNQKAKQKTGKRKLTTR